MDDFKPAAQANQTDSGLKLPTRVVVTFRAGLAFAIANIICVIIAVIAYTHVHQAATTIDVTGAAQKNIASNLIIWQASVSTQSPDLKTAYAQLSSAVVATQAFLVKGGIPAGKLRLDTISINKNYKRDAKGHHTDVVSSYSLSQIITITSHRVNLVRTVGRQATELIKQGIQIAVFAPQYIYTKLADLKISMLAAATQDARERAAQIAANSHATLGPIVYARMGVLQINPIYSTNVSSTGNDDTSSYRKTIMAVVHAQFDLR